MWCSENLMNLSIPLYWYVPNAATLTFWVTNNSCWFSYQFETMIDRKFVRTIIICNYTWLTSSATEIGAPGAVSRTTVSSRLVRRLVVPGNLLAPQNLDDLVVGDGHEEQRDHVQKDGLQQHVRQLALLAPRGFAVRQQDRFYLQVLSRECLQHEQIRHDCGAERREKARGITFAQAAKLGFITPIISQIPPHFFLHIAPLIVCLH